MVTKVKIGQSAAKYLSNKTLINSSKNKFNDFIKDRGSTTTISNPIYGDAEYKKLCYIED